MWNGDATDNEVTENEDEGNEPVPLEDGLEGDADDDRDVSNDISPSKVERKKERRKERVLVDKRGGKR